MPYTDQITELAPHVRTYSQANISTMLKMVHYSWDPCNYSAEVAGVAGVADVETRAARQALPRLHNALYVQEVLSSFTYKQVI